MLDARSNEMRCVCAGLAGFIHYSEQSEVVALGAAGGEDDLRCAAVEQACDRLAGMIDGSAGELAWLVDRAGIAEVFGPERAHGVYHLRQQRRSSICIHVDTLHPSILRGWRR